MSRPARRAPGWVSPSSRRSWKITAASWCWTIGEPERGAGQAGFRRARRARRDVRTPLHQPAGVECGRTMAHDILIVDDEADIRMLIAGMLRTRATPRARPPTAPRRWRRSSARQPTLVILDIWLQGSELDGLEILQAAARRDPVGAGGHDQRPRHDRDRGRGDQDRRLRFHRKAVQVRPAAAGRRARDRGRARCGARTKSCGCAPAAIST